MRFDSLEQAAIEIDALTVRLNRAEANIVTLSQAGQKLAMTLASTLSYSNEVFLSIGASPERIRAISGEIATAFLAFGVSDEKAGE